MYYLSNFLIVFHFICDSYNHNSYNSIWIKPSCHIRSARNGHFCLTAFEFSFEIHTSLVIIHIVTNRFWLKCSSSLNSTSCACVFIGLTWLLRKKNNEWWCVGSLDLVRIWAVNNKAMKNESCVCFHVFMYDCTLFAIAHFFIQLS